MCKAVISISAWKKKERNLEEKDKHMQSEWCILQEIRKKDPPQKEDIWADT